MEPSEVHQKVVKWPVVLSDDHGIRPAWRPDECFYCRARVGHRHAVDCVTVYQHVRFDVFIDGRKVGHLNDYIPFGWDKDRADFQKNDSSWCAGNALDRIEWVVEFPPKVAAKLDKTIADGSWPCCCDILALEMAEVLDPGPFITRRNPS